MKENVKKEIANGYNKEAEVYDETRYGSKASFPLRRVDEIVQNTLLEFLNKGSVLELGAGTGRYGVFLVKRGYDYKGIEISKGMINKAKEKEQREKLNLKIVCGDVEELRFYPPAVDNVICIRAFSFFPNPEKVLQNVSNVLREKGRFIMFYYNKNNFFARIKFLFLKEPPHGQYQTDCTFKEVNRMSNNVGLKVIFRKDIINFPGFIYRNFPEVILNMRFVRWFDDILKGGWVTGVVLEKR
ncbi:MAG: methyltransferase domain-containing protein [Dehalococcoidia bacterium]|nr:methyltransferase domain-containing protein [Dehalococcoidia bacterium]